MVDLKLINIKTSIVSLEQILGRFDYSNAIVTRDASRKSYVAEYSKRLTWDVSTQSRYIESLILQHTTPPLYFDLQPPNGIEWIVLDGYERLEAVRLFTKNAYKLTDLYYLAPEFEGCLYGQLLRHVQRAIEEYHIQICYVTPPTPEFVKQALYNSVNASRLLTPQEKKYYEAKVNQLKELHEQQQKTIDNISLHKPLIR